MAKFEYTLGWTNYLSTDQEHWYIKLLKMHHILWNKQSRTEKNNKKRMKEKANKLHVIKGTISFEIIIFFFKMETWNFDVYFSKGLTS